MLVLLLACTTIHTPPEMSWGDLSLSLAGAAEIPAALTAHLDVPGACISAEALSVVLHAAAQAVAPLDQGVDLVLPELAVDISACLQDMPLDPVADLSLLSSLLGPTAAWISLSVGGLGCQGEVAQGVVTYLSGLSGPILDELTLPDGVVLVPGVTIPRCTEK